MSEEPNRATKHRTVYDRVITPDLDSNVYHYCGTETLLSILESDRLRFSDINMMNDSGEWRYCCELFERAANDLLDQSKSNPALEGLDTDFFDKVDEFLSPKQLVSHPVICCFSKEPDVLSQWRGYADNARGWTIGFSARAINAMPLTLLEVAYDPKEQLAEVGNFLAAMYLIWRKKGGEFEAAAGKDAALLASLLHAYKHPSFEEEKEIRALHELRVDFAVDGWELIDEGGATDGESATGEQVRFRAAGSSVIAYVDLPLKRVDDVSIREIWFGPSNENGTGNLLFPLGKAGHRGVKLFRSASSYRV